jgi:quercetin dioxygenase-like cupin family protein
VQQLRLKIIAESVLLMGCLALAIAAQDPTIIPLASEPHHHLALHNEYVNVYQVEVAPHDSVLLHRHDFDAISVMISAAEVTVRTPAKPDEHRKLADGQIRLQARGYVHSTKIDGESICRNVTVELLQPQQGTHNLCSAVMASGPLNCPATPASAPNKTHISQPQFETDQTLVTLIRVLPHHTVAIGNSHHSELVVALDSDVMTNEEGRGTGKFLHSGDFVWLGQDRAAQVFNTSGDKEARIVLFTLKGQSAGEAASSSPK